MRELIAMVADGIEALAVVVIVGGILFGLVRCAVNQAVKTGRAYKDLRDNLGNSLLLGLEFLVAADIIRTVALNPTLANIAILGVLVVIRTFLSWALFVEVEGRWPWQARTESERR
jgi:uncharacterized membrane protein